MAGRENQGDLWVLSSGLDLQLPIVCGTVRWFQDTVPRLCAKFGAQRCMFNLNEIST